MTCIAKYNMTLCCFYLSLVVNNSHIKGALPTIGEHYNTVYHLFKSTESAPFLTNIFLHHDHIPKTVVINTPKPTKRSILANVNAFYAL